MYKDPVFPEVNTIVGCSGWGSLKKHTELFITLPYSLIQKFFVKNEIFLIHLLEGNLWRENIFTHNWIMLTTLKKPVEMCLRRIKLWTRFGFSTYLADIPVYSLQCIVHSLDDMLTTVISLDVGRGVPSTFISFFTVYEKFLQVKKRKKKKSQTGYLKKK